MADNREMWQSLGMDLETHDQLCAVLPTAFGDVYLSQENRPAGMAFYDFVVSDIHGIRPAELIELQKQGGKVFGTFCVYVRAAARSRACAADPSSGCPMARKCCRAICARW